jgi:hypothetical protein
MSYSDYEKTVLNTLWTWANQHHQGELDGGKRQRRPPVLASGFALNNVLVLPNGSKADNIRTAIPRNQRHRWFRSLKSSQALTQSVFGAIQAFDRLDLFQNVSAECGRPAFFDNYQGWTLDFEHEVRCLKEPRPTSVDVLLSGPNGRVAVECKFMERDFGTCSRPRLSPNDDQYCDGSYQVPRPRQRRSRCSLTEIGIRYWDHLPALFNWPADRDHDPCPFRCVYQLARNALAASLTPEGKLDCRGHVLVVYDARNPKFQAGGEAEKQWALAVAACRGPGLLRRLSWQRLLAAIAPASELAYLADGLREKYGLEP